MERVCTMKRIVAVFVSVALMLACAFSASADTLTQEELTLRCTEAFYEYLGITSDDPSARDVECTVFGIVDNCVVFREDGVTLPIATSQKIGGYVFTCEYTAGNRETNPVGLYVLDESGTVRTLLQAYEESLVHIDRVAWIVPDTYRAPGVYEKKAVDLLQLHSSEEGYLYNELYFHYKNKGDKTPSYVLIFAAIPIASDEVCCESFGESRLLSHVSYYPYSLGYYIYIPDENIAYTLAEAYGMNIHGISEAIAVAGTQSGMVGDLDRSGHVNVRDATYLQKSLAGIVDDVIVCKCVDFVIRDFNDDGSVNVRDATSIQKHIAGIKE